jgi:hypothetical protein
MKLRANLITLFFALLLAVSPAFAQRHRRHAPRHSAQASDSYYTNSVGHRVHRPIASRGAPAGASARCRDGTYSFSEHRRGTCSHHGGVASWL